MYSIESNEIVKRIGLISDEIATPCLKELSEKYGPDSMEIQRLQFLYSQVKQKAGMQ